MELYNILQAPELHAEINKQQEVFGQALGGVGAPASSSSTSTTKVTICIICCLVC